VTRIATYVIVGLLCLAMAAGVFLGGPPSTGQGGQAGQAGGGPPPVQELGQGDTQRLERQRELAFNLMKEAGAEPASLETAEGKRAGIAKVLAAGKFGANERWARQCLGVVFGDSLVQSDGLVWIVANTEGGRKLGLMIPKSDMLAFPMDIFLNEAGAAEVDVDALYSAFKKELTPDAAPGK